MTFEPFPGHPWLMALGLGSGLIFWAGVVLLVVWAVRMLMANSAANRAAVAPVAVPRTPKEILDERLAKGEIAPEDYERAKTALGGW